jgi:MFS family permease
LFSGNIFPAVVGEFVLHVKFLSFLNFPLFNHLKLFFFRLISSSFLFLFLFLFYFFKAGVGLVVFQQITGQPSTLYFIDSIFVDIGLSRVASIIVSLFKMFMTLYATFTVDKYGRKFLLYIGTTIMFVSLLILTISFLFPYSTDLKCNTYTTQETCQKSCEWNTYICNDEDCLTSGFSDTNCECCISIPGINTQKILILISLFMYVGGYQISFGPISWLLISEIFPLNVRGMAASIAVVTNFALNFIVTFIFPVEILYIGNSGTFLIYAFIILFSIYFIFHYVPETKGLTLEEIEEYFIRLNQAQRHVSKSASVSASESTSTHLTRSESFHNRTKTTIIPAL